MNRHILLDQAQREKLGIDAPRNVIGGLLETCCSEPMTGFYRTGACETGRNDRGAHVVCTQVTTEFLDFLKKAGNDLITPAPQHNFTGLKPGDKWCVCAASWKDACDHGVAAPIVLSATHERALDYIALEELQANAIDFQNN